MQVKCLIQKYDPAVKEAPFTFINVAECWIEDTNDGMELRNRLFDAVWAAGLHFRFWGLCSEPGFKYSITVR